MCNINGRERLHAKGYVKRTGGTPVPATIGALVRILTNREWEPRGRKEEENFSCVSTCF